MLHSFIALLVLCSVAQARSITPPPIPPDGTTIVNQNNFLSGLVGASRYIRTLKPYSITNAIDSTGNVFFPSSSSKTAYLAAEIDDDAEAAQIVLANTSTSNWTLTNAIITLSSQTGAPSDTTASPGITAYDGAGAAITILCGATSSAGCWSPLTWGNGGVDVNAQPGVMPPVAPTNSIVFATNTSSTGTTLNFGTSAILTGVGVGQKVVIPATSGTYPAIASEDNSVTAVNSCAGTGTCTVTIGPIGLKNTVPTTTNVDFLPLTFTIPAATANPVPTLAFSDWTTLRNSYARLDGYPLNGQALSGPAGLAANPTVNGTPSAGSIPLSAGTTAFIPAGTSFTSCTAATTTGTLTPNYTLNFTTTTGLVAGMHVVVSGNVNVNAGVGAATYPSSNVNPSPQGNYFATVTAVTASTSVTLDTALPADVLGGTASFGTGYHFQFILPLTLTQAASLGATKVFVQTGLTIGTNLHVIGTFTPAATVSAYNSSTGELDFSTGTLSGNLSAGDPIAVGIDYTNTSTSTQDTNIQISGGLTNTHWLINGGYVTGTGISGKNYIWSANSTTAWMQSGPTATINTGTAVNLCHDYTTSAPALPGATSLSIVPPKRLLLVRMNIGSANASYISRGAPPAYTLTHALYNFPLLEAGACGAGTDGVLTPSNISNTAGSCGRTGIAVPLMIKTWSPRKGLTVATVNADSHFDSSSGKASGLAWRLANLLTTQNLPVSGVEAAWGGAVPQVFSEVGAQILKVNVNPDIVLIGGSSWNADYNIASEAQFRSNVLALVNYVKGYGGIPVIVNDFVRSIYGCNTYNTAGYTFLTDMRAYWSSLVPSGVLYFDPSTIADPTTSGYFLQQYSNECVHGNDALMGATAASLASQIAPLIYRSP